MGYLLICEIVVRRSLYHVKRVIACLSIPARHSAPFTFRYLRLNDKSIMFPTPPNGPGVSITGGNFSLPGYEFLRVIESEVF
jgi:hypothetical protein